MIVRKATCPVCGNDIYVNNMSEEQKCKFCRRPIFVKMRKANGKRWMVSVEAAHFEQKPNYKHNYKTKNLSRQREEDTRGKV